MDPPINYSAAISPVCLPPASTAADQFVDKNAAIIGWGILNFPGKYKNRFSHIEMKRRFLL
jgi:hypothetical protein